MVEGERCTVLGELAAGGMATVQLGRLSGAAGFSRRVAIKTLHAHFAKDPDFLAMFLDEARLSGRIQHPNAVQVLDVIATGDDLHLVMEYVEGETVSKLARLSRERGERLPVEVAVAILIGALEGLHAAHEARSVDGTPLQLVHRDVSPQNILVGVDGLARILDFGIAKAVGRMQSTRSDQLKGKLAYMAPEQLGREPLDRRTDVFAAGIVLWELLTARRLFHADDEVATFRRALAADVPPPRQLVPGLDERLEQVVLKALARQPGERFQTARDFAAALEMLQIAASPRDLALWVEATAAESLLARAQRIAELEAGQRSRSVAPALAQPASRAEQTETVLLPLALPPSLPPPATGWSRTVAAVLLLLLGLPGATTLLSRRAAPGAPLVSITTALPESRALPAMGVSPAAEPALAEPSLRLLTDVEPLTARAVPSVAARRAPRPVRLPVAHSKAAACESLFVVDSRGIRHPKVECL